ncbi:MULTISPECIES: L,D-transpeptidase [unclassified Luteococcus]|uniref:L,D-transpeptidase n=1 Tax=unclassified Luteococcus TaxID=2639923 RepID=UPI00313BE972
MTKVMAALAVGGALLLAACGATADPDPAESPVAATSASPASAPSTAQASTAAASPSASPSPTTPRPFALTANVKDEASEVPVDTLLTVTPTSGRVDQVTVESTASGRNAVQITGTVNGQGVWTASSRLDPDARYTVTARGTSDAGKAATRTVSFRTASVVRSQEVFPTLEPVINGPYGVAQPVVIHFDAPVKNKAEFERNMHVTSVPAQEGSWGWFDDKTVHWRPRVHWKPGTKVTLNANLNGVNAGDGRYGQLNRTLKLQIGKDQAGQVDIAKHTITWKRDGKVVGTWPMTAGKPGFTTRSGTKVVMEKAENITMNSETTGIARDSAEGYDLKVAFALRVTKSGEFIHSAPWNAGNFGVRNASHGCVGMDEEQMYSLYTTAQIGDPVVFTGSERTLEAGNGWTEWDLTWEQWKARSALK